MNAKDAIAEIRELRASCELEIAEAIYPILRKFEDQSGINARGVSVEMIEVTNITDTRPRYAPGKVQIELEKI